MTHDTYRSQTTPVILERDLVVAIDQVGVLVLGQLWAAEEVDRLCDDLLALAIKTGRIGPLGGMDAALDEDLHARFAVFGDRPAETIDAGDAMPFGVHGPETFSSRSTLP